LNMENKKTLVILVLVGLMVIGGGIGYFFFFQKDGELGGLEISKEKLSKCLDEQSTALYKTEKKEGPLAEVVVSVNDKSTGKELSSFRIENVFKTSTSIELHPCSIYVIRFFNYDPRETKQETGFKAELWKYAYNGQGVNSLLLSEKMTDGTVKGDYSYDFRVDTSEKYIVLENGYLSQDNYSLVVKHLETKEDVFILSAKEISKQHPTIAGNFNMREWSEDGKYFWGNIFDGAYVLAYFRIDTSRWETDIFEAPDGAMGGFPLNIKTGYVPIQPGQIWTGDYQLTQELKNQYRKEGKKSSLYLYNLFTKEQILLKTTDEPLWSFKSKWISDTELEYELPSGEKKIYKIEEK